MTSEQRQTKVKLCLDYADIFYLDTDKLTTINTMEHRIIVPVDQPLIFKRPYCLPQSQQLEIDRQIDKMLADII